MIAHEESVPRLPRLELASLGLSSVEAIVWLGLLVVTALLHLVQLGSQPLNVDEGRRALEAYTLARDGGVAYDGAPILTNAMSIVFMLFSDGDLQARLIPALAGVALVGAPILLRPVLSTWWAILAGVALALSATLLSASRSVSPAVPAELCVLLVAIGAWRFGRDGGPGWLVLAVTAALIGIGIDTSFVVGVAGLALGYAICEGDFVGRVTWWESARRHGPRALAIAAVAAILLDTRLLMTPAGLQAGVVDSLSRWTGDIARGAGLTAPLLIGLLDGALLFLAVLGVVDYPKHPRAVRFLGTWLLVSLTLASLMRMPDTRFLVQPIVPAALLAGLGLQRLCRWLREAGSTRTILLGLAGLIPIVTAAFQINMGLRSNLSPWTAATVVLVGGLILVGLLAFNLIRGKEHGAAFATWVLVIIAFGSIAGGSRALEARGEDRGQLIEQTVSTPDLDLVRQVALKWFRADPEGPLPVDATLRPVLGWALRDIPTVRFDPSARDQMVPRLLADAPSQVNASQDTVRIIGAYSADWSSLSLQPARLWRWVANRESLVTLRPYGIVVVQPVGR
jgi:hypothetical protein